MFYFVFQRFATVAHVFDFWLVQWIAWVSCDWPKLMPWFCLTWPRLDATEGIYASLKTHTREWRGEVWRHVNMVALFLDDNKPTTARRTAKNNVYINKQQLCTCDHAILYICLLSLYHYDMKHPNFASPLWSRWTQHKNCRFLFLNLHNDRYGPKENFINIFQLKWNWIRSVKFEIVQIDF